MMHGNSVCLIKVNLHRTLADENNIFQFDFECHVIELAVAYPKRPETVS